MVQPIILAAGRGKRMNSETPKVLHRLNGKSFINSIVSTIENTKDFKKPIIVTGENQEMVEQEIGDRAIYIRQNAPLGTGDAVLSCREFLKNSLDPIIILYGDHPLISYISLDKIVNHHTKHLPTITFFTTIPPSFENEYQPFSAYGRIKRENGSIKIIEKRNASPEELEIREVNLGAYCFEPSWLWSTLPKIKKNEISKEYYLTDLIDIATNENKKVETLALEPEEALGINTREDLEIAKKLISKKL